MHSSDLLVVIAGQIASGYLSTTEFKITPTQADEIAIISVDIAKRIHNKAKNTTFPVHDGEEYGR